MRLLYIAVHEQNKDWGAEHFLAKAFLSLGVDLVTIDYRKHRKDIIQRIKQATLPNLQIVFLMKLKVY